MKLSSTHIEAMFIGGLNDQPRKYPYVVRER